MNGVLVRDGVMRGSATVRWIATDDVSNNDWPALAALLDEAERVRADRFHFIHDRQSYIAAHALARATLSTVVDRAPVDWRFETNQFGKPEAVLQARDPPIRFSLSHSRGLAAVAVTLVEDIGIDVEWMKRGNLTRELALDIFAPAECRIIEECAEDDLDETLFAFWTLKEAYVKAVGKGLSIPLESFAFKLEPVSISVSSDGAQDRAQPHEDRARWHFERFRPTAAHVMAVALRCCEAGASSIAIEQAAPRDLLRRA